MRRAVYTVMWRSGVAMAIGAMAIGDILAMDTVAMDTVAMDTVATMVILMEVITEEDTIIPTTGLITEATMVTHMVAITAGAEDSGLATVSKME
jgi:hypothetical protein